MAPSAPAVILARYSFDSSEFFAPTATAAGIVASAITAPTGTIGMEITSGVSGEPIPQNAPFLRVDPMGDSATAAMAIANDKYFQFTLSAENGFEFDLSSLDLKVTRAGLTAPRGFAVRSDVDNFAATILSLDVNSVSPNYLQLSIGSFAKGHSSITYRIYPYSLSAGDYVDFDDLVLHGTVNPVPEPASSLAFAIGAAGVALRRRNSRD